MLIAASIAVGRIVLDSGAAEWLSQLLALGMQFLPAAAVLAAVMLFVTVLTNFASNTTAAAVGTPIAFSLAQQLGIPAEPLVLAVLFGCNLCYATPVAYQTNMLIMSAGDYKFGDYTRTGVPARRDHDRDLVGPARASLRPSLIDARATGRCYSEPPPSAAAFAIP